MFVFTLETAANSVEGELPSMKVVELPGGSLKSKNEQATLKDGDVITEINGETSGEKKLTNGDYTLEWYTPVHGGAGE